MTTQTLKKLARPCTVHDITWDGLRGGQCMNCGGIGPSCYEVTHAPQPKVYKPGAYVDASVQPIW